MIRVAILGSTGSIGRSALEVMRRHSSRYEVVVLAGNRNLDLLARQVEEFGPKVAVAADEQAELPTSPDTEWAAGRAALLDVAGRDDIDVVLNALVGAAGLEPTLRALEAGHRLALANKESLVAGGPLVLRAAAEAGAEIVPIDSEHSAILQCLQGHDPASVRRLVLTASGGPFRGKKPAELEHVRAEDALKHPTWDMGAKITIDSATLANKALEVIEAHFLYGMDYDRIDAVVHPQSIVHSFVEFVDGSVLAQMGFPTMELPILYALNYPARIDDVALQTYDPVKASPLTFEEVDHAAFPMFGLGVEAGRRGGAAPAAYNAGNEIAVAAFLEGKIRFLEMADVVHAALDEVGSLDVENVEDVLAADEAARGAAARAAANMGGAKAGMSL